MNDNLDKQLEAWKEQRSPKDAQFASEEKFAADFFEKAAQLPAEKDAKKTFWPIVCKLAACVAVVLCLAVMLLKLNQTNETAIMDMPLAQVPKIELIEMVREQNDKAAEIMLPRAVEALPPPPLTAAEKTVVPEKPESMPAVKQTRREELQERFMAAEKKEQNNEAIDAVAKSVPLHPVMAKAKSAVKDVAYAPQKPVARYRKALTPQEMPRMMKVQSDGYNMVDENMQFSASPSWNTEEYKNVSEKPFLAVTENPLSTFGADVDTAGYGMMRRMIVQDRRLPPPNAIRIEELLNYFHYDYPMPEKDDVMRPHFEMQVAPWNPSHQLLLVGIQAKTIPLEELPPSHYVFLIDNSGSMSHVFPMVKDAMTALAKQLRKGDSVSMVTYGGGVNVLLEAAWDPQVVCAEIEKLDVGGYTPGGEGIQKAYQIAEKHFIKGGNNRIVLITDGDFNVGTSSEAELVEMVEAKQKSCIYLTVVGCGMGNYKDNKMKMLANKGNGNYFYLDEPREARKIFVKGMTGNMVTICRDVKFQLEFNPSKVFAYRQLGYELRAMASSDFRNDAKDSGEVGMGQQVTVLYELVPAEASEDVKKQAVPGWQPLKYAKTEAIANDELLTFRMRYKLPQGDVPAVEKTTALTTVPMPTSNWNWASSVAEFALRLRHSSFAGDADYSRAMKRARTALGDDTAGHRIEFLLLILRTQELDAK
ncbi:MAG: von Willebrand factor type A domain-containing protein [Victivallales bacterium]|nr:von Willebrand factor type A domain-containing protein [Victivallales bacterium]